MPALLYNDRDAVRDVLALAQLKQNRDGTTMSAFFANPRQKIQFGKLAKPSCTFRKFVSEGDGDQHGVQLNVVSKSVRRWFQEDFLVDLLFDFKKKREEWKFERTDTHVLNHGFRSNVKTKTDAKCVLEFRLAEDVNYWLYSDDEEGYTSIQKGDVQRGMRCVPLVCFVGLWINGKTADSEWGCVLTMTDLMCYPSDDEQEEEEVVVGRPKEEDVNEGIDLRPFREHIESPVQSVLPSRGTVPSLYGTQQRRR